MADRHDRGGQRRGDVARMRERPRLINRIRGPELGFKISPPLPPHPLVHPHPNWTLQIVESRTARQTGVWTRVKVPLAKGWPPMPSREPCAGRRETVGEASVAGYAGRAIERRNTGSERRDRDSGRRQHRQWRYWQVADLGSAASKNPRTYARPSPGTGRPVQRPNALAALGPHREGRSFAIR